MGEGARSYRGVVEVRRTGGGVLRAVELGAVELGFRSGGMGFAVGVLAVKKPLRLC